MNAASSNYVVIPPVKDEEEYIETTITAIIRQRIRLSLWVIVDDGSRDRTPEIVERYAREHSWIQVLRIERDAHRRLGSAEIRAFQAGYQLVRDVNCSSSSEAQGSGSGAMPTNLLHGEVYYVVAEASSSSC